MEDLSPSSGWFLDLDLGGEGEEDPKALMNYEEQLMRCIVDVEENHLSIGRTSSSSSSCSSSLSPHGGSGGGGWPIGTIVPENPGSKEVTGQAQQAILLSFGRSELEMGPKDEGRNKRKGSKRRNPSYAQEHVQVERRRREKLARGFLHLTSLIPAHNKIDRASIIEEAASHIRQLQEKVKLLERQMKEKTMKLMAVSPIQKSHCSRSEDGVKPSCSDENFDKISSTNPALDIEAKILDRNILVKIRSKKDYDMVLRILKEMEKLHLRPLNSSITSFGKYATDVTVVAQMENEFCMTIENLVEQLRALA